MTGDARPHADRIVVLDVVGLGPEHLSDEHAPTMTALVGDEATAALQPPFPALTVPSQTTLATGQSPATHGDVASGEYDRETDSVAFWERERDGRTRLWEAATEDADLTTGVLFFQHLIDTSADVAVTPSPIEDEDNDIVEMNCWTNPDGFYEDLRDELGHFPLHNYWGPGANEESSRWILDAAATSVDRFDPDLLWIYVPHLDYVGLRSGPRSDEMRSAVATVDELVGDFLRSLRGDDRWDETAVALVSEYGFYAVDSPVFPNRALRDAGLLVTDETGDVDLPASTAFAMVDHQVAHLYADGDDLTEATDALRSLDGVETVLGEEGKRDRRIDHPNAGDAVLVAEHDAWFQYYWWEDDGDAPPYATDMDIHAKPGFDPCELFVGESGLASLDPSKVGGSHGRVDDADDHRDRGAREAPPSFATFALGGPAVDDVSLPYLVRARDVAPTLATLQGVAGRLGVDFEGEPLVTE